jgi:hypothetical protein
VKDDALVAFSRLRPTSKSVRASAVICLGLVFSVSKVLAQTEGVIQVSSDPGYGVCTLVDSSPGIRTIYVLHTFNPGATASRFRIAAGPGVTMTYLSEDHPFPMTAGNTQDGISVCYGTCYAASLQLAAIYYMTYGTSAQCSKILVLPHPAAQTVEAINCGFSSVRTYAQDMNVGSGCACPSVHVFTGTPRHFDCLPLAVEATTWGRVKSLYR